MNENREHRATSEIYLTIKNAVNANGRFVEHILSRVLFSRWYPNEIAVKDVFSWAQEVDLDPTMPRGGSALLIRVACSTVGKSRGVPEQASLLGYDVVETFRTVMNNIARLCHQAQIPDEVRDLWLLTLASRDSALDVLVNRSDPNPEPVDHLPEHLQERPNDTMMLLIHWMLLASRGNLSVEDTFWDPQKYHVAAASESNPSAPGANSEN